MTDHLNDRRMKAASESRSRFFDLPHFMRKTGAHFSGKYALTLSRLGPPTQQAAQQPSASRPAHQLDVAHELGAPAPAFEHDLAAVEGLELGPVPDAHQGRFLRPLAPQRHQ